jgi:hypothetical protein
MSNAARKARKRFRMLTIEASAEVSDTAEGRQRFVESEAPAYQHPKREGIPYGRSKAWSIDRDIADMHRQMDVTRAIVEAVPDIWPGAVGR